MSGSPERTGVSRPDENPQELAPGLVERASGDDRVSVKRILVPGVLFACGLLYVLGGLALRQLRQGGDYADEFRIQSTRVIQIPAPRGCIYDRDEVLLVGNKARYNIVADLGVLREEIREEYLRRYRKPDTRSGALTNARVVVIQRYLDAVNTALGLRTVVDADDLRRYLDQSRGKIGLDFPLIKDLTPEQIARFAENFPPDWPLHLYVDSVRSYTAAGMAAPHVLGYLGNSRDFTIDEDDPLLADILRIRREKEQSDAKLFVRYDGKTGVSGLEFKWNDQLQGTPGSQVWMVNPRGYLYKKIGETRAQQGSHMVCSLDAGLQEAANAALISTKEYSHESPRKPLKGAIVAVDIGTGEILAMASLPAFDPNQCADGLTTKYYAWMKSTGADLNRGARGVYPPGSTFKPILAVAGMRDGKLDPDEELTCPNSYTIGKLTMKEHDWQVLPNGFGQVDMAKMLRVSCNVYCYQMGLRIGIDDLVKEVRRFGLNKHIDLEVSTAPASYVTLKDPAWRRAHGWWGAGWASGDTLNFSIGQGDLRATPLHMLGMIASVAADRTHTDFTLLHDPSRNGLMLSNAAHHAEPLGLTAYQRKRLLDGLRSCVQEGTGKPVLAQYEKTCRKILGGSTPAPSLDIVGKTGTAEWSYKDKARNLVKTNLAWFTGFAPGDNPKIAVVVLLEGAADARTIHGGAHAGKLAGEIFATWRNSPSGKKALGVAP